MIRVAMLWLRAEDGSMLLARRADHKSQDPGLWGPSVTGKLEPGETYEQALRREATEELGLSPDDYSPRFLLKTSFMHPDGQERQFQIYATDVPKDITSRLVVDANEVAEVQWMLVPEIRKLLANKSHTVIVASAYVLWEQIFTALES